MIIKNFENAVINGTTVRTFSLKSLGFIIVAMYSLPLIIGWVLK